MLTEAEWRVSENLQAMLAVLRGNPTASERKLRLFACTCAGLVISQVHNRGDYLHILSTAEKMIDGAAQPDEIRRCMEEGIALETSGTRIEARIAAIATDTLQSEAYSAACGVIADLFRYGEESAAELHPEWYACLLRCIFGIPYRGLNVGFRPVKLDPQWRTSSVLSLASGMYESRDFSAMPILADSLQDAGCDSDEVLNHCRDAGPHARGCWVVDLVLGKV